MIPEIPTPIALLLGGYIIGSGYLAYLSFIGERKFNEVNSFDKFIVSLTFGTVAFSLIIGVFNININFSDENSLVSFVKRSPFIFILNIFIARILMSIWVYFQENILRGSVGRSGE